MMLRPKNNPSAPAEGYDWDTGQAAVQAGTHVVLPDSFETWDLGNLQDLAVRKGVASAPADGKAGLIAALRQAGVR